MIKYPIPYHVWYILFPYISHKNQPHVGKYTLDGSYGIVLGRMPGKPMSISQFDLSNVGRTEWYLKGYIQISGKDVNLIQLIYKDVHVFRSNKYFEVE